MKVIGFFFAISFSIISFADEATLLEECRKQNISSCESLGDLYFSKSDWGNAYLIGEALCGKDIARSCMIAGSSLLAQGKTKEALKYLTLACDKFEPFACRSMARLMSKAGEKQLARMYFKRTCHYGLKEICTEISDPKSTFTKPALTLLERITIDCSDAKSEICALHFKAIESCTTPLTKLDCQLMAGHLSIYFRAKIIQEQAKILLLSLHAQQNMIKNAAKSTGYSLNMELVQKDAKPLEKYHYVFGFMKSCVKKYSKAKNARVHSQELYPKAYKDFGARAVANSLEYFTKGKAEDCYDPKSAYEAYAVGSLDPLNPSRLDVWMIDQDQRLKHVSEGLPLP